MDDTGSNNSIRALQRAFSTTVSWMKATSSARYRFEVLGVGEFHPDFHITAHAHAYYEVGLGLEGRGELVVGKELHIILPGSLYVVGPGTSHRLSGLGENRFYSFIFHITPELVNGQTEIEELSGLKSSKVMENKDLLNLVISWCRVNQNRIADQVSLSLFARYLAFEMLGTLSHGTNHESWTLVERAKGFIEKSLPGKLEVPAMAAYLDVSERTLRRHFQTELGKSIIEFVNERRLLLAERHLALHLSVADVAQLVGFESSSQLSRLFQKAKGITPKAWQQSQAPTRRMSVPEIDCC